MLVTMMVMVPLAGCNFFPDSDNGQANPANPYTEPNTAYGLYHSTIDGYFGSYTGIFSEWSDSLEENVEFDILDSDGTAPGNGGIIGDFDALFNIKNLMIGADDNLAYAVRIDYPLTDYSQNPLDYVQVTIDSRVYSNNIQTTAGPQNPSFTGSNLDQLEAIYDPSTETITIEGSSDDLFVNSNQIELTIDIVLSDSKVWRYERISHFQYVLPLNVPHNDLEITGIEVTQAIQTENNDISLVAGKETLARVYVDSTMSPMANSIVTLELCDHIWGCYDHLRKIHLAVDDPMRATFTDSANFILPPHWTQEVQYASPMGIPLRGIILKATVEPYYSNGMDYAEIDWSDNELSQSFDFSYTTDLTVWSVRVGEQITSYYDPLSTPDLEYLPHHKAESIMGATEMLLPVSSLEMIDFGEPMTPQCMYSYGADDCMSKIETWWQQIHFSTNSPYPDADQIHGMTPHEDQIPSNINVGNPGFWDYGGLSCPAWACGWFGTPSLVGWTPMIGSLHTVQGVCDIHTITCAAHEMTHNFGPYCFDPVDTWSTDCNDIDHEAWGNHLSQSLILDPCGTSGQDPVWHNHLGDMTIKDLGWNSLASNSETNQNALVPDTYPDYMSNCQASMNQALPGAPTVPYMTEGDFLQWVSTHRWEWMFDKFDNWDEGNPAAPYNGRSIESQEHNARMITGSMASDGTQINLEKSWEFDGLVPEELRNYGGNFEQESKFKILVKNAEGETLESIFFNPPDAESHTHRNYSNDNDYTSNFVFTIQDDEKQINSIELYDNGRLVQTLQSSDEKLLVTLGDRFISENLDSVELVEWQVESEDDVAIYSQLEYSWDGDFWMPLGSMNLLTSKEIDFSQLPGGDDVQMRVRVTNGFDTFVEYSESFDVKNHAPSIDLEIHGDSIFNMGSRPISFEAEITDLDMETIDTTRLTQTLTRDGVLVWGEEISKTRDSTWLVPEMNSKSVNENQVYTQFPNSELLPGEFVPGKYVYSISYTDVHGELAEIKSEFTVDAPISHSVSIDELRKNLTTVSDDVIESFKSLDKESEDKSNLALNRTELVWLVEYERMIEEAEITLPVEQLNILADEWGLDVSILKDKSLGDSNSSS